MNTSVIRSFFIAAAALALVSASTASAGVIRDGALLRLANANFSISALEGVDPQDLEGQSGFQPQVNQDFEFTPSIGVTYDLGGKLTDFGLGLYKDAQGHDESTGLMVNFDNAVDVANAVVTVEDFDIKLSDGGFKFTQKVAPLLTLIGADHSVGHTFTPQDIWGAMTERLDSKGKETDVWDISIAKLLANAHINTTSIGGFVLAADMANGETDKSDPFLLLSVSNPTITQLPEASNYIAGMVAVLIAGLAQVRSLRRRKNAA